MLAVSDCVNLCNRFFCGVFMEKKIAVIGIVLDEIDKSEKVNSILHEFNKIIIGRMGLPYREKYFCYFCCCKCNY